MRAHARVRVCVCVCDTITLSMEQYMANGGIRHVRGLKTQEL